MPEPIQSSDFQDMASSLATPPAGEAVAADAPVPTDRYLTPADVEASKAASAAPAADAVADPASPAAPAAAATPAAAAATPAVPGAKGKTAPPEDRWDAILANARAKAKEEVEGEYAWAKDLSKEDVVATREWITLGNQNPLLALDKLVSGMIRSNPDQKTQIERYFKTILQEAGPAVAAAAAAASAGVAAVDDDVEPGPDIPTDTSNGVPMVYSAAKQKEWGAWHARQLRKEFQGILDKDLKPILNEREQIARQADLDDYTERSVGAISGLPGFEKYKAEIASAYAAMPASDKSRTEGEKLRDAYLSVVSSKMSTEAQEAVVEAQRTAIDSVNRRAEAATVNPSSQGASQPFDYKTASWEQALRHEFNTAALSR